MPVETEREQLIARLHELRKANASLQGQINGLSAKIERIQLESKDRRMHRAGCEGRCDECDSNGSTKSENERLIVLLEQVRALNERAIELLK